MRELKMPQSEFLRWGLDQSEQKSILILALPSSQIGATSPRNALYVIGEIGESFSIQKQEKESEEDSKNNCSEKRRF